MASKKSPQQRIRKPPQKTPPKKTTGGKNLTAKKSLPKRVTARRAAGTRRGWTWAPAKPQPAATVYQFRITLLDVHPPIWRRIEVQDCFLDELHGHIQDAMGWADSHMYLFDIDGLSYGRAVEYDSDGGHEVVSASQTLLRTVVPESRPGFSFRYTYDLGDGWEHLIVLEGARAARPKAKCPICLDGRRACPPENCGGTPGYEHLLCVLHDPEHDDYDELLAWTGEHFDPEDFDPKRATRRMSRGRR